MICLKKKHTRFKAESSERAKGSFKHPCGRLHPTVWRSGLSGCNDSFTADGSLYSESDPDGSYTGVPRDLGEVPVQDADDL